MNAPDRTSEQPRAVSPQRPVFVDASGRRLRGAKLAGLAALGLVAGYVVLLLVAFMGGSNIAAPYLPMPAAAGKPGVPAPAPAPASPPTNAGAGGAPGIGPAAPAVGQAPPGAAPPAPDALQVDNDVNAELAPGVSGASPVATAVPEAPGMSGADRGLSGSAPGQASKPSAPARP